MDSKEYRIRLKNEIIVLLLGDIERSKWFKEEVEKQFKKQLAMGDPKWQ